MNHILSILLITGLLTSCSSDEVVESPVVEKKVEIDKPEDEAKVISYLFRSEDEGVVEYMRSTVLPDGTQFWTYFSEKNKTEIKLGTTDKDGFEAVYFQGKPKELYVIGGSECGFMLSDETRGTSQWYGQLEPRCADDMFE